MDQTISLLQTTVKNKTVAELVVTILSQEWPLPLKTIQRKINKEYGKKASPQATYKSVKRLVEKQILVKQDLHYELNTEWLKQINNFSLDAIQAYINKNEKNQAIATLNNCVRVGNASFFVGKKYG